MDNGLGILRLRARLVVTQRQPPPPQRLIPDPSILLHQNPPPRWRVQIVTAYCRKYPYPHPHAVIECLP